MKSLISIALVVFAGLQAEARSLRLDDSTLLHEGSKSIVSVAGQVTSLEPLCPTGMVCVAGGTIVNLRFDVGGCVDQMLPISYVQLRDEVIVHAQVVRNEGSLHTMCNRMPVSHQRLQLVNTYPPFRIRFMGTTEIIDVK